jgi:hypothetical protein
MKPGNDLAVVGLCLLPAGEFEFRNQIPRLSRADALGTLIEKLLSPGYQPEPQSGC